MDNQNLTREKHLDHLVRVVPLLSLAYGIQSYLMMSYAKGGSTGTLVMFLGVSLALSVMGLVTYDYRHKVTWNGNQFSVKAPWSFGFKTIEKDKVAEIEIIGAPEEFQTVIVKLKNKQRLVFYFVDNGHEFKASMEEKIMDQKYAA
ncbi:MAG: hypothetical protein K2P81_09010 [Bacteriovoracaceae bacterium]|nr:hypothetical protein [Bacteriovoracaceae bacterium]